MKSARFALALAAVLLSVSLTARGQANGPPTVDANVVNTPDVIVANDPSEPVPVSVVAPPETSVMCYRSLGGGGGGAPFGAGGSSFAQSLITCPAGVDKVDVQRLVFTPDIGGAGTTSNVAKYRITVSFSDQLGVEDIAGFLAILTEGAPQSTVAQNFRIDTTDANTFINASRSYTSGIDNYGVFLTGTLYFIGSPVP